MNKNHHGGPAPVPPGNRPQAGPGGAGSDPDAPANSAEDAGAPFQDQDAQRRLGDFTGTGEHSRQQPGQKNDGDQHSR